MPSFNSSAELSEYRQHLVKNTPANLTVITVCGGTGCLSSQGQEVFEEFQKVVAENKINAEVKQTGCMGLCELGPLVIVYPQKYFYHNVHKKNVAEIIETTVKKGKPVEKLLYKDVKTKEQKLTTKDIQFYAKQNRQVFAHNGLIRPTEIDDYIKVRGYEGLQKALAMQPGAIIDEVE